MRIIPFLLATTLWSSTLVGQQPAPPLTLERVTAMYLQDSIELQAGRHEIERIAADRIAARLRPNPGVTVSAENLAVNGPAPFRNLYELSATYTATIERGGKRDLREKTADLTVSVAEARFESAVRRGLAEIKRLYYAALLARHHTEVARDNRRTFEQLLQFTVVRFQEGAIPEGELIKVRLERVKFDAAVRHAELLLSQRTIRLLAKLGSTPYTGQQIQGNLTLSTPSLDREALRRTASTLRPDIVAAAKEVDAARSRLNLENARATPDITPFAGYKRVGSDNTVLVGVTIPLMRDRNRAGIARAQADIKMAESRLQLLRNQAMAEVDAAFEAFRTAQELAQLFQKDMLEQADESRAITVAAYEEGGTDLLPVLDAQRTRAEIHEHYFTTLFDYRASLVDLELATGMEIQP